MVGLTLLLIGIGLLIGSGFVFYKEHNFFISHPWAENLWGGITLVGVVLIFAALYCGLSRISEKFEEDSKREKEGPMHWVDCETPVLKCETRHAYADTSNQCWWRCQDGDN